MPEMLLRDSAIEPTKDVLRGVLANVYDVFEELDNQLKENEDSQFLLYLGDGIAIVTKPYKLCQQNNSKTKTEATQWYADMRSLICEILDSME